MAIADRLTPEKIIELGEEYEMKLTGETDLTPDQTLILILVGGAVIFLAAFFAFFLLPYWIPLFRYSAGAQFLLFLAIVVSPLIRLRWFLIFVPKFTLVQATDFFTGRLHTYTTGAHLKSPTYLIAAGPKDYIDTRLIIIEGKTAFVTKDGVVITYTWTVQARIIAKLLAFNVRTSIEDMAKAVADIVENALAIGFLGKSAKTLRNPIKVKEMQARLTEMLNAPLPEWVGGSDAGTVLDAEKNPIWVRSGAEFEISTLSAPDFGTDYKEALSAKAISEIVNETARKFAKDNFASPDVALNSALILNKENVKRDVIAFEGIDKTIGKALITVMRILRK